MVQTDIRDVGSGNVGATNAFRAGGAKVAILTLVLDVLKVVIASLVLKCILTGVEVEHLCIVTLAAVLGHIFPVWLGFKGGKGVAPGAGALFVLSPMVMAVAFACWLTTFIITRISSLSALIALFLSSGFCIYYHGLSDIRTLTILCLGIIISLNHHSNIKRLINGTEKKL